MSATSTFTTISAEEKLNLFVSLFVGHYAKNIATASLIEIVDSYQAAMLSVYGSAMANFINNGMRIGMDRIEAARG